MNYNIKVRFFFSGLGDVVMMVFANLILFFKDKKKKNMNLLNQKGSSIAGALVATSVITISFLVFQSNFLRSTKDLQRLKLKTIKRMIVTKLKISALSVTALKKTKDRNPEVKKCIDAQGTCDGKTWHPINWFDSAAKKVAGKSLLSEDVALYNEEGFNCTYSSDSFNFTAAMTTRPNFNKASTLIGYSSKIMGPKYIPAGSIVSGDRPSDFFLIRTGFENKLYYIASESFSSNIDKIIVSRLADGELSFKKYEFDFPKGKGIKWEGTYYKGLPDQGLKFAPGKEYGVEILRNTDELDNTDCNFLTLSSIKFYCPNNAETCSKAESAEVKYEIRTSSSSDKYIIGGDYAFNVIIPRVNPEVVQTSETRQVNTSETRHTSSTQYNTTYVYTGDGDGDGDGDGYDGADGW